MSTCKNNDELIREQKYVAGPGFWMFIESKLSPEITYYVLFDIFGSNFRSNKIRIKSLVFIFKPIPRILGISCKFLASSLFSIVNTGH